MSPTGVRQRDADHRDPGSAVPDDQGAVPVGLDVGRDVAGGLEPQELDAARHCVLVRQFAGLARRAAAASSRQRARASARDAAVTSSWTLARIRPCASRASMSVPGRCIGGVAQDVALLVLDDGVAALERRERAHGVQGAHERQQPLAAAAHALEPAACSRASSAACPAAASRTRASGLACQKRLWYSRNCATRCSGHVADSGAALLHVPKRASCAAARRGARHAARPCSQRSRWRRLSSRGAWRAAGAARARRGAASAARSGRMGLTSAARRSSQRSRSRRSSSRRRMPRCEPRSEASRRRRQPLGGIGHHQLGGRRGRGRAHVGGEVGDGEVDLVPDAADHGDGRGDDGARQALVVERPQILERAAAAGEDQHVAFGAPAGELERRDDLRGRLRALHRPPDRSAPAAGGKAPRQHVQDVAHRRAGGRGDDADAPRQGGQRALALGREQAFAP